MENKIIIVAAVALIIGLVAGYGLNYVIYQPQLQRLQDEATNYQSQITNYQSQITNYQSQINNLTAIIANMNNSPTPTPTPAATVTPSPTSTPSSTTAPARDKLEFTTAPTVDKNGDIYDISFAVQNTGSSTSTLSYVYINGISNALFPGSSSLLINGNDYSGRAINLEMKTGDIANCTLTVNGANQSYTSGTLFAIAVGTTSGAIFSSPSEVQLP